MTTLSSTLQINLVEDATKNAPRVAAALEKMQKEANALQAALAKSGTSDKLQARLKTLAASETHIEGVTRAWRDYSKAEGLAEKAGDWTQKQAAGVKVWEDATVAAVRLVKKEEAALAKARHEQTVRAEHETIQAAQHKAAEERRLAQEVARDAKRLAEQQARDQRMLDQQATRDAEREERARLRMLAQEQRQATQRAEVLAHERSRTDNTVAGVTALYAAHSAMHAAVKVGERYREFDKERRYAQVVMGASDEQMKPLVDQAIRGSANSKFNDVQWLAAQRNLAARGYNRDQVLGFTPTASQLGQAFDIPMEEGVKLFEGAMLGFKKDVSTEATAKRSAQRTADLEVKTSKISGADAEDLIQLYKRGAAAAQMAGLTEEQLLAFGGTAKKVNIGGDEAATAFVALTKSLLHPTREARTAMTASGIDFSKYQKIGTVNEDGFATEVARNYGVKLKAGVRAGLHRIFTDKDMMADPAKFTPAITRLLRRDLYGNDAKSLKSIAGLAGRYRDDSATGVDTQGLLTAIMAGLSKNPALANVIFGAKQAGRISAGLNPEMFAHLLDELTNHSEGYAEKVSDARMAGFNGALDKLSNHFAILETRVGGAFDSEGNGGGGFITHGTEVLGEFVHLLGEANPRLLRVGGEAVLLAGAFAALKSVDFLRGGFGLKASASALDLSAKLLDDAAVHLGATKGGVPVGGEPAASPAAEGPPKAPSKGFFGEGGLKSAPKGILAGGPAAIAEYFAYQFVTGIADTVIDAGRDHVASKEKQYRADKFNEQWFPQKFGYFGGTSDPMDPRFAPPPAKDTAPPKVPTAASDDDDDDETPPIAGKRASGGPVSRGKTYLVGEHGPELFTPGMNGAVSTADVQRLLSRAAYTTPAEGGEDTAKAVRAMAFGLANAVDGIARAIDRSADMKPSAEAFDQEGGSRSRGGRQGFMDREGHFGGRRGFAARAGHAPGHGMDDSRQDGPRKMGRRGMGRHEGSGSDDSKQDGTGSGAGSVKDYANEEAARLKGKGFTKAEIANVLGVMKAESHFKPVDENLHYKASTIMKVFPGKFSAAQAEAAAAKGPEGVGNLIYGGRMGNKDPGDGYKYRGRGLTQLTGRNNYKDIGERTGLDLENHPELVNDPKYAAKVAAAYWDRAKNRYHQNLTTIEGATRAVGAAAGAQHLAERSAAADTFAPHIDEMAAEGDKLIQGGGVKPTSNPQPKGLLAMNGDGSILGHLEEMRSRGMISDKECVTLAMGSVGIRKGQGNGGNVHDWRVGDNPEDGTLKPGTPVSTFLDRQGHMADRYAVGSPGGGGTRGAHLDHAGVFETYLFDKAGKRIGFQMAEQYAKSRGVMEKKYYFHQGQGEGDASNYRAVKTQDGAYLGGRSNPMSGPTDDPLALRKKKQEDHLALADHLRSMDGMPVSPDFDHNGIDRFHAKVRAAKAELASLHSMRPGQKSGAAGQHLAGLGSRTRGNFSSGGLTIG